MSEQDKLQHQDAVLREEMRQKAGQNPSAQRWVDLDQKVDTHRGAVEALSGHVERRQDAAQDAQQTYESAVQDRQSFLLDNPRPSVLNPSKRQSWDKESLGYANVVEERRQGLLEAAQDAEPSAIGQMQERLADHRQQMEKALEQRQGIAKLPSERAAELEKEPVLMEAKLPDSLLLAREQRRAKMVEQGSPTERPRYGETLEDRRGMAQLEETQAVLTQRHGQRPTEKQISDYEAERAEAGKTGRLPESLRYRTGLGVER